jgi:murein DD-endopeptidase MepM/ murein hydrolase activator NlpD
MTPNGSNSTKRTVAVAAALLALALAGGTAFGQDLYSQKAEKQAELEDVKERGEVLSSEISDYSDQISQLAGEVAVLRNREAIVAQELRETIARLQAERARLAELRDKLDRSLDILSERLVDIYKSDQPDALTVLLDSDGFDDLVNRYDYLTRIQDQDALIVARVRTLRDQSREAVERISDAKAEIAAKKAELERTRMQLETREAELDAVRDQKAAALDQVRSTQEALEGDISDLSAQIEKQLQQAASTTTSDPLPAGAIQAGSGDMIWPVNGVLTSPFGYRWGRLHAGIDIAVPEGTPIRAAKSGQVTLASYYGGYGNYTCIDHGGGLSTCYGHQSGFAVSQGDSVSQGEVIGYSGNTGSSTGPHLHFEVRVNGTPVDPMGYL